MTSLLLYSVSAQHWPRISGVRLSAWERVPCAYICSARGSAAYGVKLAIRMRDAGVVVDPSEVVIPTAASNACRLSFAEPNGRYHAEERRNICCGLASGFRYPDSGRRYLWRADVRRSVAPRLLKAYDRLDRSDLLLRASPRHCLQACELVGSLPASTAGNPTLADFQYAFGAVVITQMGVAAYLEEWRL
ncbi:hypothetical protein FQR65_LT18041 [Abscondita terminalis]|nr:hypothetical protein FQR65_LT18041 [Abscondita terminalis]